MQKIEKFISFTQSFHSLHYTIYRKMQVKNLEHLKKLSSSENGDFKDFYITIANGLAKSSKRIVYHKENDEFSLIHEIDETYQEFLSKDIGKVTNLLEAINNNALFRC